MESAQDLLKVVFAGHVDHGKSSVIGRLLYDTRSLPQGAVDKVKRIARETGKAFEFAYLLDALEEEQKQGITIDSTRLQFRTKKRGYVIIDAPGHKEFLKNMVSGAADAESAFLVIDAARGVEEQSTRHACMLSLLGIRQICVLVNKMDLIDYDEARFLAIKADMDAFFASLGLTACDTVPLSALRGENILRPSPRLPWHAGKTLVQALDSLSPAGSAENAVLRLPVQDVYKFDERRIIAGRIESGRLRAGDGIVIHPGGKRTRVASLESWPPRGRKDEASAGESVGITLDDEFFNQRGEVISHSGAPPLITGRFQASIFWLGKNPLRPRQAYRLKIATQSAQAVIDEILRVIDSSSLAAGERTEEVRPNEVAKVVITTKQPVVIDLFSECRAMGRFVLLDGRDVAGGGIVTADFGAEARESGFAHGGLKVRCELFEEYYYSLEEHEIRKRRPVTPLYTVGDAVPLSGGSFSYPEFFDVIALRDQAAVKIREGRVSAVLPLAEYAYAGLPLVNGRGFALRVSSSAEWRACLRDYSLISSVGDEAAFSSRWLLFEKYRRIPVAAADRVI
ncbi:MAG: sulfate adenylyltransferase [Deltaproteobacteria bacterium]|jgi:sulfate adenylyltransferase large subunit|nr:sulfate adenylyltransferase [Deltaproteobacteria bacterium]